MFGWSFEHDGWVQLMWAVVAIVGGLVALELRGQDALARFLSPEMQRRLAIRSTTARTVAKLVLFGGALACGVLAIMRPQTKGEEEARTSTTASADVIVVLDVSRSMLAEDVAPSRLARARTEIKNMAGLPELDGWRFGLVAFAGRAALMCPLTADHAFFDLAVDGTDTRSVARGGTRIGDAIRVAVKSFPPGGGAKLIVLITDGEDHQSFPLDAADAAKKAGVHIVAIGLGSKDGAPIFVTDPKTGARTQVMRDGKAVMSKLDEDTLRKIAFATEGAYVPAGTSALDLESIVKAHVGPIAKKDVELERRPVPGERYQWFVLGALVLLLLAVWVGSTTGERS